MTTVDLQVLTAWNMANKRARDDYRQGLPTPYCYHAECPKAPTRNGFCARHSPSRTTEATA